VEPPTVLAIGRLVPKKGFDVLVEAAARLEVAADVVIIGDGPCRADLQALVDRLGAGRRIRLLGAVDHAGTLSWLRRASVLAGPFRIDEEGDRDSMPVVVKEAMAAGLPVVASDEVGVPEMVEDGRTGILVPPGDPEALAAALDSVLADPARAAAMGQRGWERVAQRFRIEDQARAMLEVLA
jgi:glycosyltransferase involved in cell wall biosynthesis